MFDEEGSQWHVNSVRRAEQGALGHKRRKKEKGACCIILLLIQVKYVEKHRAGISSAIISSQLKKTLTLYLRGFVLTHSSCLRLLAQINLTYSTISHCLLLCFSLCLFSSVLLTALSLVLLALCLHSSRSVPLCISLVMFICSFLITT